MCLQYCVICKVDKKAKNNQFHEWCGQRIPNPRLLALSSEYLVGRCLNPVEAPIIYSPDIWRIWDVYKIYKVGSYTTYKWGEL